jgi:hypothetical protein
MFGPIAHLIYLLLLVNRLILIISCLFFCLRASAQQGLPEPTAKFSFDTPGNIEEISGRPVLASSVKRTDDRFGNDEHAVFLYGNEDSYLNLGSDESVKPLIGSISLWVKIELVSFSGQGYDVNPVILTKNSRLDDFFEGYGIYYVYETNRIQGVCTYDSVRQVALYCTSPFDRNKWHHLVLTYDNDSMAFYVDGKKEGKLAKGFATRFEPGDPVLVGATGNKKNNRFLNGVVDDIFIYDRALTDAHVKELYEAPNPNRYKIVLNYFLMFLAFALVVASIYLLVRRHYTRLHAREQETLALANAMLQTELTVNRALMNPHFVFNSLYALQELILKNDTQMANSYLVKLSKLLRKILETSVTGQIALELELDLLKSYVEVEQLRFNQELDFQIIIQPEIRTAQLHIPVMMLQIFLENAIWHGLQKKEGSKQLLLKIDVLDNRHLLCTIEDNGCGLQDLPSDTNRKSSMAMKFIEQRLSLLNKIHGFSGSLKIGNKTDGGTRVIITLPILNSIKK